MPELAEDTTKPTSSSPVGSEDPTGEVAWGSPTGNEPQTSATYGRPAYISDRRFYRIVVRFLGAVAVLAALGTIVLAAKSFEIPDSLVALGSASIGALASLVAGGGR